MPRPASKELLEKTEVRLRIMYQDGTPLQNQKGTAIELLRRGLQLEEGIHALKLPYTYDIIGGDPKKVQARRTLGGMSVEILETMRDEFISVGVAEWLRYEALRDSNGSSTGSVAVSATPQQGTQQAPSSTVPQAGEAVNTSVGDTAPRIAGSTIIR